MRIDRWDGETNVLQGEEELHKNRKNISKPVHKIILLAPSNIDPCWKERPSRTSKHWKDRWCSKDFDALRGKHHMLRAVKTLTTMNPKTYT